MKILMLCDFFNESLEYQENLLLKYYAKHGHDVVVVCSNGVSIFDYCENKLAKNLPTTLVTFNNSRLYKLRYRRILMQGRIRILENIEGILEKEKPDLVFAHDISPNFRELGRYLQRNPNCKVIMDYHADYSNSGRGWISRNILHGVIRKRFFLNAIRSRILKYYPVVPPGFQFLNEMYGVPFSKMELLPLAGDFDVARDVRNSFDGIELKSRLGIREDDFVIFTGGKLNETKRTHLLIEALKFLPEHKIHVLIAGKAETEEYSQRLKQYSSGQNTVHFLGWLNSRSVYEHMSVSDIAVFPSSQSVLWQQSIGMHLPMIVGDSGGQSAEYLNRNENLVCLPDSKIRADCLSLEIRRLTDDKDLRQRMRGGAERTADEFLNWNRLIYKTLEF